MKLKALLASGLFTLASGAATAATAATELVVATVNNGHMIEMQKLARHFEAANPDITLKWVTLEEGVLRQCVTADIATDAAQKFIQWSTSRDHIKLVAAERGWAAVPTGTRKSTYLSREFRQAAKFAEAEQKAIFSANPTDSTLPRSPYVGVQFAAIPEFQAIGIAVGPQISAALAGRSSVDDALKASQAAADREMKKAGHYK